MTYAIITRKYVVLTRKLYCFYDITSRYYDIIEWKNYMCVAAMRHRTFALENKTKILRKNITYLQCDYKVQ